MDIKSSPRVTVLMGVYNGDLHLVEAVESILNQTFSDFEFLIIDDCSTDRSGKILTEYQKQDSRVKLVRNENNLGLTVSLNKGIRLSSGEFIARMDADDIADPTRLKKQVELLADNSRIGVCGTNVQFFNETGNLWKSRKPLEHNSILPTLFVNPPFFHSSVMFRRELIESNNLYYNEQFRYAQDYDLWYRMLKITEGANLEECLLRLRITDSQISIVHEADQSQFAGKVRMQVLRDLGVEANDEISRFHTRLLSEAWDLSKDNLRKIDDWFQAILHANLERKVFSESHFSSIMAKYYYEKAKCQFKLSSYLVYRESTMSRHYKAGIWPVLLYQAKSAVKYLIGK